MASRVSVVAALGMGLVLLVRTAAMGSSRDTGQGPESGERVGPRRGPGTRAARVLEAAEQPQDFRDRAMVAKAARPTCTERFCCSRFRLSPRFRLKLTSDWPATEVLPRELLGCAASKLKLVARASERWAVGAIKPVPSFTSPAARAFRGRGKTDMDESRLAWPGAHGCERLP